MKMNVVALEVTWPLHCPVVDGRERQVELIRRLVCRKLVITRKNGRSVCSFVIHYGGKIQQ
jgi:hypothetical protein